MADTSIAITAGTGTDVDTRTEATNGNHRQVVVLGDPSTNAGVAPVDATNGLAVQVIPALPAGNNNIGDVDVASIVPGTGATNLGKAEDAGHTTGDVGVFVMGVRRDTSATTATSDADYSALTLDANGKLWTNAILPSGSVASGAVASGAIASGAVATGAFASGSIGSGAVASGAVASGAFASGSIASGAIAAGAIAAGATSIADNEDVLSADGDRGVKILVTRKATPANVSGTDGDYEFLQMSAGRLWTSATIDAALPAGTAAIGKLAANDGVDIGDVTINNTNIAGMINPGLSVAVSVTRPSNTTTYGANDVVGVTGGGTAGIDFNIAAISASNIMITSVAFERDTTALISGETSYNLHLYNITPPSALVDNDPHDLPSGDRASYLGVINLGVPVDLGSTLYVETNIVNKQVKLAGTHIFGYLVTVGTYQPTSAAVHKITLNAVQL